MEWRHRHALRERKAIQAIEMKFLRAIRRKTERHRVRSAHIREELRIEDTQNQVERNRLQWFRHVKRMDEHRIPKKMVEVKMSGKRPRGRP
jgi:hypothetical protein